MAYPQAPIEMDIYMKLPQGIQTKHGNSKEHVLKLEEIICGQKQAGRMWNLFLVDNYMKLPQGIQTKHGRSKEHVLKLEKNICGQKQAGRVWNLFLVGKLTSIGFTTSLLNDCIFFHGDIIFMVYMDDCIFLGSDDLQLQEVIKEIQNLGLNIEDQGHPANYVGVNIKKLKYGSYEFTQQALIDSIINDVGLKVANRGGTNKIVKNNLLLFLLFK